MPNSTKPGYVGIRGGAAKAKYYIPFGRRTAWVAAGGRVLRRATAHEHKLYVTVAPTKGPRILAHLETLARRKGLAKP